MQSDILWTVRSMPMALRGFFLFMAGLGTGGAVEAGGGIFWLALGASTSLAVFLWVVLGENDPNVS